MGLDFSHGEAHWAYSGFGRFREKLANAEGFNLNDMEGFLRLHETPRPMRSWDTVTTDLKPLLNHSDCDGELTPQECKQVAPRLKQIIADWPLEDRDRDSGLELVAAMEHCAGHGENLEFC